MRPRIKICCIKSIREAQMAITAGADVLGLVSQMPSGPGVIDDATIATIADSVPPGVATFLLTSKTSAVEIIKQAINCRCSALQLVDEVKEGVYAEVRQELPVIKIVQVLHVTGPESIEDAKRIDDKVDAILLDSGNPSAAIKELGGTGRVHNWEISAALVTAVSLPVYLAGGLKTENIAEALDTVKPFGIDLCSGVRTDDQLDAEKLNYFMKTVWEQ